MKRLTKLDECGDVCESDKYKDMDCDDWYYIALKKLAYYEDLEERIYSMFEDITIEMIVGEIESEHNKSIETILSLCKKLKEMTK